MSKNSKKTAKYKTVLPKEEIKNETIIEKEASQESEEVNNDIQDEKNVILEEIVKKDEQENNLKANEINVVNKSCNCKSSKEKPITYNQMIGYDWNGYSYK